MLTVHNIIYIYNNNKINNTKNNVANVKDDVANVKDDVANVKDDVANVKDDVANVKGDVAEYKCYKCDKVLQYKRYLIIHEEKCKGVKNSLECHICHKVFNNRATKSLHIKTCKSKTLITIDNHTNDTTNINHGTINNINTTINNNNITVISFGDGKDIQFVNDHITAKMLTQMYSDGNTADGLRQYMQKLLEVPENRLVKKTNAKQAFSKVHCGNGNWETRLDQDIYPKLVNQMANDNWDKIRYYNNSIKLRESLTKRLLDNLEVLTSWDRPDDYEDEQKKTFKQTIGMLKLLVVDISKL
jgi:hypothetical protein